MASLLSSFGNLTLIYVERSKYFIFIESYCSLPTLIHWFMFSRYDRKPTVGYEVLVEIKHMLHDLRMDEKIDNDLDTLPPQLFEDTYSRLAKNSHDKYEFIFKAGNSLKEALFNVCQSAWRTEQLPKSWSKSTLIQLYKGSGSKHELKNHRFIHIKNEFSKFFGNLVMGASKETLVHNMTKFQIGSKPGHRAQEHLFTLKSVLSFFIKYDKPIILSTWDISKFFDREDLRDCLNEAHNAGIKGKLYRLMYKMNENTCIRVQTPLGLSSESNTGENLAQGSVDGAILSAVSIDKTVSHYFSFSRQETFFLNLKLGPLLYMDDIARVSLDIASAQTGFDIMECVAESKLLDFNQDKSGFVVFGNKRRRQEIIKQLDDNPLKMYGKSIKRFESFKYLGDFLSGDGLSHSIDVTIAKRKGLVKRSIYEIRCIVDDCRSAVTGGIVAGIHVWEMAVIPMLLYNAETWQEMDKKTLQELENLQHEFLRTLLAVGSGCPIPLLLWETGTLMMEFRILQKKLLFLHHLANLPDNTLAKEVLCIQNKMGLPGIEQECSEFLSRFGMYDLCLYSKERFKKLVRGKIFELNREKLLNIIKNKSYKKVNLESLEKQAYELKSYFKELKVNDSRIRFKIETKMLPTVKMNFQSDNKFTADNWVCDGCRNGHNDKRDSQSHVLSCEAYEVFRTGKDLTKDQDLVDFFKLVVDHRLKTALT